MINTKEDIQEMYDKIYRNMFSIEAIMCRLKSSTVLSIIGDTLHLCQNDLKLLEKIQQLTTMGDATTRNLEVIANTALTICEEIKNKNVN